MGINSRFLNLDTDVTLSSNSDEIIPSQKAIKTYIDTKDSNVVHKTGNETIAGTKTFTTKITSPIIETGTDANNYFQSQKFRGQGDANTYQHAIDFGYAYHDQMDFYEYGGKYVFHKHTGAAIDSGDTILGQINSNGWEGNVKGNVKGNVTGNVTGNLTGTASKATADANGNTITSTYIPKNFGGNVSSTANAVSCPTYGTSAQPAGYFKNVNLLHTVKNSFYRADKNLFNTGTVTITCSYDDVVTDLGKKMVDGSYSGYYTSINPSTDFSTKPFVWTILSSAHFEVSDVCRLMIVGHRLGGTGGFTAYKLEVASAYNSGNPTWYTLVDYNGTAVDLGMKQFGLYSSEISTSPAYHNICGVRLTISAATTTVFQISEILLLCSRGTENVSEGIHALDVGKGGKVVGDITIPTDCGSFVGNLTGNASTATSATKATQDASGNTITTTYVKKTDTMTGATSSAAGASGLVPAPSAGDQDKFLKGDGTWSPVSGGSSITADGTTIVNNSGTISTVAIKEQRASTAIKEWVGTKAQYDAITTKDSNTKYVITDDNDAGLVIDSVLSTTSTNAVENRVVTNAIQNMATAKTRFTGEIIESSVPLSDAGLHLLDGSVIIGNGAYNDFVTYMASKVSTNPEIFTTEANWQQSITDFGVCSKFVYSSGDNSIRLPKTFNDERFLIDSYNSNGSWYNVYSDGWCEQGQIISISSSVVITINLLKEFADTNYCVFKNYGSQNDSNAMDREVSLANKTTSSFTTYCNTNDTSSIDIMACGYIDITTLQENPLYKYIVIANVTNTQVEIDINEVMAEVNNKVDKDDLGEIQCVVEEYSSGSSWYRIYSDGWCEQGGRTVSSSGSGFETVTLLKPYTNTNYSLSVTNLSGGSRGDYRGGSIVDASTITVGYDNGQSSWETKGYIS